MTDQSPQRPPRPKHVPFWPVLIGIAFMVAVVISGLVASNRARHEHLTISTSTLPPRGATSSTTASTANSTSTLAPPGATTVLEPTTGVPSSVAAKPGSDACTASNLEAAAMASGQVDQAALGSVTATQFKCVSGYALAHLVPSKPDQQSAGADFKLQPDKTWKMLSLGDVNPLDDGVPRDIAAQLALG